MRQLPQNPDDITFQQPHQPANHPGGFEPEERQKGGGKTNEHSQWNHRQN